MPTDHGTHITIRKCGKIDITSIGFDKKPIRHSSSDLDEVILILVGILEEKKNVICSGGK